MIKRQDFVALFRKLVNSQHSVSKFISEYEDKAKLIELKDYFDEILIVLRDASYIFGYLLRNYNDAELERYSQSFERFRICFEPYVKTAMERLLNCKVDDQDSFNQSTIEHEDEIANLYQLLAPFNLVEPFNSHQKITFTPANKSVFFLKDSVPSCIHRAATPKYPIYKKTTAYPNRPEQRRDASYEAIRATQEKRLKDLGKEYEDLDDKLTEVSDDYIAAINEGLKALVDNPDVYKTLGAAYEIYEKNSVSHPVKARVLMFEYQHTQRLLKLKSDEIQIARDEHRSYVLNHMRSENVQPQPPAKEDFERCLGPTAVPRLK